MLLELGRGQVGDGDTLGDALLVRCEEVERSLVDVVHATEALSHIYRPGEGAHMDLELSLDLIQQVKGILSLTVELIDEDHHGSLTHTTDLHESAGLGLYPLSAIDDDDDAIDSGKCAEGILCEVLVTRGIKDIYLVACILEAHDRGSYRDPTLLLDLHPVTCRGLLDLVALDGSCYMDSSPEEE